MMGGRLRLIKPVESSRDVLVQAELSSFEEPKVGPSL